MKRTIHTTRKISSICGVTPATVISWINQGQLKAFRTLGGHRRVLTRDLIAFLKENDFPIPDEFDDFDFRKILIVDDEPNVLSAIAKTLKKNNKRYKIYTALDGFEAGQSVNRFEPDLVILDIRLPGIDGFKVCKLIRKYEKKIKIIAITGYHSEKERKRILSAGADYYLRKPIDTSELLRIIEDSLGMKDTKSLHA